MLGLLLLECVLGACGLLSMRLLLMAVEEFWEKDLNEILDALDRTDAQLRDQERVGERDLNGVAALNLAEARSADARRLHAAVVSHPYERAHLRRVDAVRLWRVNARGPERAESGAASRQPRHMLLERCARALDFMRRADGRRAREHHDSVQLPLLEFHLGLFQRGGADPGGSEGRGRRKRSYSGSCGP